MALRSLAGSIAKSVVQTMGVSGPSALGAGRLRLGQAALFGLRGYADAALTKDEVTARVLEVVKNMEKVDPAKVNAESCDFTKVSWEGHAPPPPSHLAPRADADASPVPSRTLASTPSTPLRSSWRSRRSFSSRSPTTRRTRSPPVSRPSNISPSTPWPSNCEERARAQHLFAKVNTVIDTIYS